MTQLNSGLKKTVELKGSLIAVGELLGCSRNEVINYLCNRKKLSLDQVSKIVKATKSQVKPQELRPDLPW